MQNIHVQDTHPFNQRRWREVSQRQVIPELMQGQTNAPSYIPNSTLLLHPPPKHLKLSPLEKFNGQQDKLHEFLARCHCQFLYEPECFPNDTKKALWAGTYLSGPAYNWFRPIFAAFQATPTSPPPEFSSFVTFESSLKSMFGNPNEVTFHERLLTTLQQTGPATEYITQFRLSQSFVGWNDEALASTFRRGLTGAIKDALVFQHPCPKSLDELINAARRIDARLNERSWERKHEVPCPRITTCRNRVMPPSTKPHTPPSCPTNYCALE
jgi:hypothetical protein